jgi:hypothetical protein
LQAKAKGEGPDQPPWDDEGSEEDGDEYDDAEDDEEEAGGKEKKALGRGTVFDHVSGEGPNRGKTRQPVNTEAEEQVKEEL